MSTSNKQFEVSTDQVYLSYEPADGGEWVEDRLKGTVQLASLDENTVSLGRIYFFHVSDWLNESSWRDDGSFLFSFATKRGDYWEIPGRRLGVSHEVYLYEEFSFKHSGFSVDGQSIFQAIEDVFEGPIALGGSASTAIPIDVYAALRAQFPTRTTLRHFARTRMQEIVGEYVTLRHDMEAKYEAHLERQRAVAEKILGDQPIDGHSFDDVVNKLDLTKYRAIKTRLDAILATKSGGSETEWQQEIARVFRLIYPRYIALFQHVRVKDSIADTFREFDMALLDSDGSLDLLEIKKPGVQVMRKSQYRDNYVPTSDLNGAVVQLEKYLFHLARDGERNERKLQERLKDEEPALVRTGLQVSVTNPQGIVIAGRSNEMDAAQLRDFNFYRRALKNVVEIITYDELLDRLDRVIAVLEDA